MQVIPDAVIDGLVLEWYSFENVSGVRVPDCPVELAPIGAIIQFTASRRELHRLAERTLEESRLSHDWGGFDFSNDACAGVVVDSPYNEVCVSREAWLRLVIRHVDLFMEHTPAGAHPDDLGTLLSRLRDRTI